MKILIILGTGALLTFPMDERVNPDCFSQGHAILKKISVYREGGLNQGWVLNDSKVQVGGWYCHVSKGK